MINFKETEDEILKFWEKNKIFEKSVKKKSPKGAYIFYDGPPFITGLPHYGTILPSIIKDAVPRFWTMKGFSVERVWGWDCHGLPAENQVEKELGLKNKTDIEKLGVGKFVGACKNYVNNVSEQWNWYIDSIGRWVDMKKAYRTMDLNFMESVIWGFKELYKKGLIYEGYRSSLHCPRCATPLSKFEITMDAGSYKNVTELSAVVKFKLKDSTKLKVSSAEVLAWTTTPWTLPGNLALAINKKIKYVLINIDNKNYILAKDRINEMLKNIDFKIIKEFLGNELIGLEYESLFDLENKEINENKNIYKIYHEDFVNIEDGTGVVHIAPNFGEDDFESGKKHKLPLVDLMDDSGIYTEQSGNWKGFYFKDAGKEVLRRLGDKLFSKFNYTHSYPFCHRCSTSLIYKTQKAWYLNTDMIRKELLKTNETINWVPDYFKQGRFKYNLETAPHWCLSRSRYWGSPIPVWKCEKCEEIKVAGSIKEIEKLSGKKVNDLHRPEIDKHKFKCKCGGVMNRVLEILDCWFESGSMPYAQWHYPFERKKDLKKIYPADFITEYTGQLRGWFYYLNVLSNSLFNSVSFKNVIVTGVLAGNDGRKMSKSYGNYPDPKETIEKYGGDAMRMYFLNSPVINGGDMNIDEKGIKDSLRKNVMLLNNIYEFYEPYNKKTSVKKISSENILDKWIVSRLNELIKTITENMEKYDLPSATKPITQFIEDLSVVYIRQNRERINNEEKEAIITLKFILENLSKVIAPFMPFISENIWQKLNLFNFKNKNQSVHLQSWPEFDIKKIDKKLIKNMETAREIISITLKEREINKIPLKQPLQKLEVKCSDLPKRYIEIILKETNIKEIELKKSKEISVKLDLKITPELEAEGYAREMSRQVQAFRKKLGLNKKDKIELFLLVDDKFKKILDTQEKFIKERTNSIKLHIVTTNKERFKNKTFFNIKDKRGEIGIVIK
ncbi:MAG: isoleucine--tRNA ligase [Nanoarchaeota archaeon]|nr:isoleucine--tRNA ligase [Nanoarchaeota archaeon]MBU4116324.1 isoleucine--tRNA ligase [Nanoarchaeota archaeon]